MVDAGSTLTEEVFHPPQITDSLLTDITDEEHVGLGLDVRVVHGAQHREHGRETARVVRDAGREQCVATRPDGDVGLGGEHRVQVSSDRQHLT